MDIVSTFLVNTPSGLWTNIINAFQGFLGNFALAIILLTICIKVVFIPLDFLNRKNARDNARAQAKMAPEMEKLQRQYAHDPNTLNQKRMELYKKSGLMSRGGCVIMLVYMVLTLVVFCTLFTGILSSNAYRQEQIYLELRQAYTTTYTQTTGTEEEKIAEAQKAVLDAYDHRSSQFLWVQNVWLADNPWTQTVVDFNGYLARVGDNVRTDISQTESVKYSEMTQEQKDAFKAQYDETMAVVIDQRSGVNGFLITTLLAAGTAFLSQYIMQRKNRMKGAQGGNKILMIILPAIMGLITMFYNAIFGLYIIAMQLFGLATMPIFDKILDKMYAKKQLEEDKKIIADYSRK